MYPLLRRRLLSAGGLTVDPIEPRSGVWDRSPLHTVERVRWTTTMSPEPASPVLSVMLIVSDADAAVAWYREALGARELWNLGGVAGLALGDAAFFLHETVDGREHEQSPAAAGLSTTRIELFLDDPQALVDGASSAGATAVQAVVEHQVPWGVHRQGGFTDPFGHRWSVGDRSPLLGL
jgi:PhnB protein